MKTQKPQKESNTEWVKIIGNTQLTSRYILCSLYSQWVMKDVLSNWTSSTYVNVSKSLDLSDQPISINNISLTSNMTKAQSIYWRSKPDKSTLRLMRTQYSIHIDCTNATKHSLQRQKAYISLVCNIIWNNPILYSQRKHGATKTNYTRVATNVSDDLSTNSLWKNLLISTIPTEIINTHVINAFQVATDWQVYSTHALHTAIQTSCHPIVSSFKM